MFDTIHLDPPLVCPHCGTEERAFQTKHFGSVMADYRIGSVIPMCPVLTGILRDELYCSGCPRGHDRPDAPVYLGLWHTILVAVGPDLHTVEKTVAEVDRADLIEWIAEAQREKERWKRSFWSLRNELSIWNEHRRLGEAKAESAEGAATLRSFFHLPPEVLEADNPLEVILERHSGGTEPDDGWF